MLYIYYNDKGEELKRQEWELAKDYFVGETILLAGLRHEIIEVHPPTDDVCLVRVRYAP